jgi:hypothetical protein
MSHKLMSYNSGINIIYIRGEAGLVVKSPGPKHLQGAGMTERSFFSELERRNIYEALTHA